MTEPASARLSPEPARAHGSSRLHELLARVDPYLIALIGCMGLATLLPARGAGALALDHATDAAIGLLFFLYGARLSPQEAWAGARNVRLQLSILGFTYALFPLLGLLLGAIAPGLLAHELYTGLLFLCALPSTVQSSIAFTSIARGNVAAALCAATFSNLLGVLLTPLLVALLLQREGVSLSGGVLQQLALQLLAPFFLGQVLRPRIQGFVERQRRVLGLVDRGSILLVVYAAFSEGVVAGIWQRLSPGSLALLLGINALLLALVLRITRDLSRRLGFSTEDEIAAVFCGSKKSLASGLPIASVLFPAATVSVMVLPLMLFHQLQLMACAWLARRYAERV